MLVHVRLCWCMLSSWGPCWGHLGPMLGQEQCGIFRPGILASKNTPFLGQVGAILDFCRTYVSPCWALGSHVGAMLSLSSAKNIDAPKGTRSFAVIGLHSVDVGAYLCVLLTFSVY